MPKAGCAGSWARRRSSGTMGDENRPRELTALLEQSPPDGERVSRVADSRVGTSLKGGQADGVLRGTTEGSEGGVASTFGPLRPKRRR